MRPASASLAARLKAARRPLLCLCLLEPLFSGTRARPGANQFVVLADNSQSMTLQDRDADQIARRELKALAAKDAPWLAQLGQDFDLRQYAFDTQLSAVGDARRRSPSTARPPTSPPRSTASPAATRAARSPASCSSPTAAPPTPTRSATSSPRPPPPPKSGAKLPPIYPVLVGSKAPPTTSASAASPSPRPISRTPPSRSPPR